MKPEEQHILHERALALAREVQSAVAGEQPLDLIEFLLGREHYAVEAGWVREVLPLTELTPLPGTPAFVLGIVNVRGQILSVMDLKRFFDVPEESLTDLTKIIVLFNQTMEVGVLADAVVGTRAVPGSALDPPLPTQTGVRAEYLRGIVDGPLIVLDAAAILSDAKLVVHEE
jgi:purine-binding chemotaxis protein CheW